MNQKTIRNYLVRCPECKRMFFTKKLPDDYTQCFGCGHRFIVNDNAVET